MEHWDVNRHLNDKRINTDFIGRDEKKALLMKIASKMQSRPEGFAGNFIHRTELENEIEEFIESSFKESPSNSRIIARHMIDQLRERNFILCLYGADFFGFVHRTFLEYFCAKDIVTKFDNHELDIKRLKEDYFSKYWKDPAWHEVLRLICGMKDKFAGEIIEYLMQVYDPQYFGDKPPWNIVLAIKCLSELKNPNVIEETAKKLLERILKLFEMVRWTQDINQFLAEEVVPAAKLIGDRWPHREIIIDQFSRSQVYMQYSSYSFAPPDIDLYLNSAWAEFIAGMGSKSKTLREEALKKINNKEYSSLLGVLILGKYEPKDENLFSLFLELSAKSRFYFVRITAVQEIARGWHEDPDTIKIIKQRATNDEDNYVRSTAVQELARGWHDDPETIKIIKDRAMNDDDNDVRQSAVQELKKWWSEEAEENIEENVLSENITDPSISENANVKNVSEDFSGDVISKNIEVDNVQTSLNPTDYGDENTEVTENIEIPEKIGEEKVSNPIQVKKIAELKVNSDSDNVETLLVSVSKREKEIVRIAAIQLNFKLSDTGFPPQIIDKSQSKSKVMEALKMARDAEVDIVCLPELCICEDWIPEIKDACQNIAVIAGSYYDAEKHNVCQPLLDSGSNIPPQIKIIPSPFEEKGIISQKMIPGDRLHIYDTKVGKFSVLICRDFINLRHQLRGMTDIIFVPSYNKEIKRFHDDANNHINNGPAYIVISNTSLYGGTSVFGRIRKELNSELVDAGYKAKDDGLYKLCELKEGEEGLIIADFNLVHKSIQVPTPANPAEDIRPVPYIEKKVTEL